MTRDLRGAAAGGRDGGPLVRAVPGVTRGRPPAVAAAGLRVLRKIRHVCPGRLSTVVVWDSWWWMRTGSRGCWRRCARI